MQGDFDEAEDPDDYEGESDADSEDINENDATPASKGGLPSPLRHHSDFRVTNSWTLIDSL